MFWQNSSILYKIVLRFTNYSNMILWVVAGFCLCMAECRSRKPDIYIYFESTHNKNKNFLLRLKCSENELLQNITESKYFSISSFMREYVKILFIWSGYKGVSGIVLSYPLYYLSVFFFSVAVRLSLFLNYGWCSGGTVWYK